MTFVAWDVIRGIDKTLLSEKLITLEDLGFKVVPFLCTKFNSPNIIQDMINHLKDKAKDLDYPIDGIVFKFNDVEYGRSLGQTSHHFKNALAFKFADDTVKSYLTGIDWTMGRTGVLTPVAEFKEIELEGSIVCRASLHNLSILWDTLGEKPYFNQEIEVFKANMIIPHINFSSL